MVIANSVPDLANSHTVPINDEVLAILCNIFSSALYAWDSQTILHFSSASRSIKGDHGDKSGSEHEITVVYHSVKSVDSVQYVAVWGPILKDFFDEEFCRTIDQIADPPSIT